MHFRGTQPPLDATRAPAKLPRAVHSAHVAEPARTHLGRPPHTPPDRGLSEEAN